MPNIKSSQKRMEISRAARFKNRAERSRIRTAIKRVRQAENGQDAQARFVEAQAILDRAATRRLVHPNAVARLKGQLQRHVTAVSA